MADKQTIKNLVREYLPRVVKEVKEKIKQNQGKEIVGEVLNRPDDLEIGIDKVGEEVLTELLKKHNVCACIFSEPENGEITNGEHIDFYGSIDPFDGSMIFLRGFEHNWYSALSFFDKERKPVCCGIVDILNEKFFISDERGAFLFNPKTGEERQIFPSKRRTLNEPLVIASYLMSPRYSVKFFKVFGNVLEKAHTKTLIYPQGGSFIYAYLASGLVDAYMMFNEPRSEIDAGFCMAKAAGCEVVSVNPDGTFEDYEFLPGEQHGKIDFFVAANGPQLRDELIRYYLQQKNK